MRRLSQTRVGGKGGAKIQVPLGEREPPKRVHADCWRCVTLMREVKLEAVQFFFLSNPASNFFPLLFKTQRPPFCYVKYHRNCRFPKDALTGELFCCICIRESTKASPQGAVNAATSGSRGIVIIVAPKGSFQSTTLRVPTGH